MEAALTKGSERRRARRHHRIDEHGIASVRVRPGHDVTLVDISAGGALIETDRRLLPGTSVEIHFSDGARSITVRSRVLRCAVARLRASAITYRGAVAFDRELSWFGEHEGRVYSVPRGEMRRHQAERGEATQGTS